MNFVQATSTLIDNIRMEDLAIEMKVSRGLLAQSRLHPTNAQHRNPPEGWEAAVVKVARRRAIELDRLAEKLSVRAKSAKKRGKAARKAGRKAARGKRGRRS